MRNDDMRKIELLAPAGSMEALIAAVQNGCDALYLGGVMFGARAFANNFDRDEMMEALQYAHSYGVKVYVTMNTLLFEEEMEEALAYAGFLYEHGVDALIIQDLGLFDLIHQTYPELELHASTQMHIHSAVGIKFIRDLGMKRVVLPRETPIEEIAQYTRLGIDVEVFVQGALCVAYSGQCLMSAKKLSRSGNRGACAQMCRMKYRLGHKEGTQLVYEQQEGDYLLSPKDLNTLRQVPALIEAGVTSFKIEGRMKRPAYVAQMVSLYRKAIDAYTQGKSFDERDGEEEMRKIFNREFTSGHLFHQKGSALINPKRPNHMGIELGTVLYKKGKRATIQLTHSLHQHDGIRFLCEGEDIGCMVNKLYVDGLLKNQANAGQIVEIDVDGYIPKGCKAVKTSDVLQLQALQAEYEREPRKVMIHVSARLYANEPLKVSIVDEFGVTCAMQSDQLVEQAIKTPLSKERIDQQLRKCGDTIFQVDKLTLDVQEGITIPIKVINETRRAALLALYEKRIQSPNKPVKQTYHRELSISQEEGVFVSVHTQAQLEAVQAAQPTSIFCSPELYAQCSKQDPSIGMIGKRVMKEEYPNTTILCSEAGGISCETVYADHFMNVTNSYTAAFLFAHGVKGIILSNECDETQIQTIKQAFQTRYGCTGNFITYGYGREELMVMEYCPINYVKKDNDKQACGLCKGKTTYFLEDLNHHQYVLYGDEDCRMHILDDEVINQLHTAHKAVYLSFYDEDEHTIHTCLENIKKL